jgi:hypothetical protein
MHACRLRFKWSTKRKVHRRKTSFVGKMKALETSARHRGNGNHAYISSRNLRQPAAAGAA